jgi:farnesyl-diphosphate farnesyltransferase
MTGQADGDFCRAMLPLVSRTFAACIGLLPEPLRHRVLVSYLLCRIADTVEDHPGLDRAEKGRLLAAFSASLADDAAAPAPLAAAFAVPRDADGLLTREQAAVWREFQAFPPRVRAAIRPWVQEMCDGMAGFAARQPEPGAFSALDRVEDLDRYCWFVAGTVGHLLTDLFRIQSPRIDAARHARLKALATDFGLGLQLTNIIKDVADDRRRGWSFVPRDLCAAEGFSPEELLDPARSAAAAAVMGRLIAKTRAHLDRSLAYCLELPREDYRIRLFCLTPLYFAVRTLAAAAADKRLLDPAHKVKITRRQVYRILASTHLVAPSDALVAGYYRRLAGAA